MEKLSESLELDFHKKDPASVRLPVINFLDTQSLLSWLAARKIILDMGNRFDLRIQFYVSYFMLIDSIMVVLLFAFGSGFISGNIMSTKAWIVIAIFAAYLTIYLMAIMLPSSYINM